MFYVQIVLLHFGVVCKKLFCLQMKKKDFWKIANQQ